MATSPVPPDHLVELPDGRHLALDERGPADGPVVAFLASAPGSRRLDPDPAATTAAGIRLLTVDRPGYGASSPLAVGAVPSIAAMADDIAHALGHLGVADAAVAGWSAGGRVALALSARHPDLVRAVAVLATPAPDDEVPWVPEEHRQMAVALRKDPSAAVAAIAEVLAPGCTDPAEGVAMVSGGVADEAVLADPEVRRRLTDMLAEGFAQGSTGVALDITADQVAPWGFDPAAVGAPALFVYGSDDVIIGAEHGRWYADQVTSSELRVVPDAGHLVGLTEWRHVLIWFAAL